jgi:AcrR family transcriptional regulator
MDEKLPVLLAQTIAIFMQYGIRSVTMDDLARQLGVSKKTLYKYVSDKKDLVLKTIQFATENQKALMHETCSHAGNAIEEQIEMAREASIRLKSIHPSVFFDLEKYYPEAWKILSDFKRTFISNCIKQNIERGQEEGLYRTDIDAAIISAFHTNMINIQFIPEIFPVGTFSFESIHQQLTDYHLRGIVNENGINFLNKLNA